MSGTWSCPTCARTFAEGGQCPDDETRLIALVAQVDPLLGTELGGFTLRQRLGSGGMGTVYRAFQHSVGREVALKVLQPRGAEDPEQARRFMREARLGAQLSSPGIVTMHDFGQAPDGRLYLAMELVEGETLRAVLQREGPLPDDRALRLAMQLCDALIAAHAKLVIHRDLKPANIMVIAGPPERIKVLDFGLARGAHDSALTGSDVVVGSANFIAPEVIEGGVADARADLYALGAVLFAMLEGEQPFGREGGASEIMLRQLAGTPRAFQRAHAPALEELVRRLLDVRPERRPGSAVEVRARLEALAEGDGRVERPPTRPLLPLVGGAALMVVVGALWWNTRSPVMVQTVDAGQIEASPMALDAPRSSPDAGPTVDAGAALRVDAGRPRATLTPAERDGLMGAPE